MEPLSEFVQSPLLGLVALAIGLPSLVFGFMFYRRSRQVKSPCWAIRSVNLVRGFSARLPDLEIRHRAQRVENLTVSKILFWNAGTAMIDGQDVVPGDPLRLVTVGSSQLLDVKLLKANNEASRFLLGQLPDGSTTIEFDSLDHNEGAAFEVIHTGTSSADLAITGTIKGAGRPKRTDVTFYRSRLEQGLDGGYVPLILLIIVVVVTGGYAFVTGEGGPSPVVWLMLVALASAIMVYILKAPTRRLPNGLEVYREDT